MKAGSYFLVATLIAVVASLFLTASPAEAFGGDTMPHYGNTSPCSNGGHMVNGTHTGTGSYQFRVCKALSTATRWKAQLINVVTLVPLPNCGYPEEDTTPERIFNCTALQIPAGTYLASITYKVQGNPFTHAHYYYIKP
jgi:hypothetical protein